jgi:hypothetical protein
LSTAGMATLLSVLTSIGSAQVGPNDSPSVIASTEDAAPPREPAVAGRTAHASAPVENSAGADSIRRSDDNRSMT